MIDSYEHILSVLRYRGIEPPLGSFSLINRRADEIDLIEVDHWDVLLLGSSPTNEELDLVRLERVTLTISLVGEDFITVLATIVESYTGSITWKVVGPDLILYTTSDTATAGVATCKIFTNAEGAYTVSIIVPSFGFKSLTFEGV